MSTSSSIGRLSPAVAERILALYDLRSSEGGRSEDADIKALSCALRTLARHHPPVSKTAIKKQGQLLRAIRKGKEWARISQELESVKISSQRVFRLRDVDDADKVVAYYKEGRNFEPAVGYMEKLIWDIAVLGGLEKHFVPTGKTKVYGGTEGGGSVQPNQKGVSFEEYLTMPADAKPVLTTRSVINGVVISLIMSMFDAHPHNIILDPSGDFKFFDNTRSFPHANGLINQNGRIVPSYRCSLLMLPKAATPLSDIELCFILEKIKAFKARLPLIEHFLMGHSKRKEIEKSLPPGWLNPAQSLRAMHERVDAMEKGIEIAGVRTLLDLALYVIPKYKFCVSLLIARTCSSLIGNSKNISGKRQQIISNSICDSGYIDMEQLIRLCYQDEINPKWVYRLSRDPRKSFENIYNKVVGFYRYRSLTSETRRERSSRKKGMEWLLHDIQHTAVFDDKDTPSEVILFNLAFDNLTYITSQIFYKDDAAITQLMIEMRPMSFFVVWDRGQDPVTLAIHFTDTTGLINKLEIDYRTEPGKYIIISDPHTKALTVEELKSRIAPFFYYPNNSPEGLNVIFERIMASPRDSWVLIPAKKLGCYFVYYKKNDSLCYFSLESRERDGLFRDSEGKTLTLQTLIQHMATLDVVPIEISEIM